MTSPRSQNPPAGTNPSAAEQTSQTKGAGQPASRLVADGIVDLDSPFAKEIGFTSDKFYGYLWKTNGRVLISLIGSLKPGRGDLSRLFQAIESRGLRIAVPTPMGKMESILYRKGFRPHYEDFEEEGDDVEVWEKS